MTQTKSFRRLRSLLGEFVIIVAGVLAALAVQQWQNAMDDRELEAAYIERLRADLAADTASFAEFDRTYVAAKASVLSDLLAEDPLDRLGERPDLMQDLSYSSFIALPTNRPATFEELQSTGGLSLLRDIELRGAISSYYSGFEHISRILSVPDGDYRQRLSRAMPGNAIYDWRLSSKQPSDAVLREGIMALLREPGLEAAVNSELAYTATMAFYLNSYRLEAVELLARLDGP
jgi:hypothetical protein